jgi:hypothetical protein
VSAFAPSFLCVALTICESFLPKNMILLPQYADKLTKWPFLYLQILFAESKNANASIRICIANNLFAHADTKKDAKKLPLFAK